MYYSPKITRQNLQMSQYQFLIYTILLVITKLVAKYKLKRKISAHISYLVLQYQSAFLTTKLNVFPLHDCFHLSKVPKQGSVLDMCKIKLF